ncbi:MAG: hypothetical protein JWO33_1042, partial [Caulobacteraceae bacterium]|nr:hypothetical protein [Caulobacteraceae bacterium]
GAPNNDQGTSPMSNLPNSEPKTFKTPETPESRSLEDQDKAKAQGSGARPDDVEDNRDRHTEKQLDHGLKETFPASDPVSINPGAD